jgi:hypothetical protein
MTAKEILPFWQALNRALDEMGEPPASLAEVREIHESQVSEDALYYLGEGRVVENAADALLFLREKGAA